MFLSEDPRQIRVSIITYCLGHGRQRKKKGPSLLKINLPRKFDPYKISLCCIPGYSDFSPAIITAVGFVIHFLQFKFLRSQNNKNVKIHCTKYLWKNPTCKNPIKVSGLDCRWEGRLKSKPIRLEPKTRRWCAERDCWIGGFWGPVWILSMFCLAVAYRHLRFCSTMHTGIRDPIGHFSLRNSQLLSELHQIFST